MAWTWRWQRHHLEGWLKVLATLKRRASFTGYVVRFRDFGFLFYLLFCFLLFLRTRRASHWEIVIVVSSPGIWELELSPSASDIPLILFGNIIKIIKSIKNNMVSFLALESYSSHK